MAIADDQRLWLDEARKTIRGTLVGELPADDPVVLPSWVLDNVLELAPGFDTPLRSELAQRRPWAGLDTADVSMPANALHELLRQAGLLHSLRPQWDLAAVA